MKKNTNNNYFLYDDNKSSSSQPLEHTHNPFDDFRSQKTSNSNPQQVLHGYQALNSKLQEISPKQQDLAPKPMNNTYPSLQPPQSNKPYNTVRIIGDANYGFQPQTLPQVEYKVSHKPPFNQRNHIHITVEGANYNTAIMYAQTVPCQRCGLVSDGQLNMVKGRTIWAWGTGLFLLTGIFCLIPCFIDKCKDTWVSCARCGHKKAVVKSNCCC